MTFGSESCWSYDIMFVHNFIGIKRKFIGEINLMQVFGVAFFRPGKSADKTSTEGDKLQSLVVWEIFHFLKEYQVFVHKRSHW